MRLSFTKQILFIGLLAGGIASSCADGYTKVDDVITPLPSGAVKLSGYLEQDIQNSITHWNKGALPYSEFVEFFRSGRKQFALGEMWGKSVRSGCMFYRYTQDPELKAIMKKTVEDLLTTEQANGSISCVRLEKQPDGAGGDLWERKYVLLGMDEYYENVDSDPRVLESMKRQADCIIFQVGEGPNQRKITDLGWSPNRIESCSLLEPFMRLYKLTGEERYLGFARYIVEVAGGAKDNNIFRQANDNVRTYRMGGVYPKAYEMTSVFEGLVEYYRVTGNEVWHGIAENLYNNIRQYEITIIGNGGGDKPYHPSLYGEGWDNTALEQTNPDISRMMETCVGVTWMKFCSQMLRVDGDSSAADEIEKYIYNGLLGAMKPTGDGFSYVNLLNGEKVTNQGWGYTFDGFPVTCCNLNGPMGLAYIPYVAVMDSQQGPVVNLYNDATVKMKTPQSKPLSLKIDGNYPLSNEVKISVTPENREQFTLALRIPEWSQKTILKVNGKRVKTVAGEYSKIERTWKPGDIVDIVFDMQCHLIDAPHGVNPKGYDFQALKWGPIVLARDENIDPNYSEAVDVVANKDGIVNIEKTVPSADGIRMEFIVPTTDGPIHMVDYSSVNGWKGKKVCTWLPMKTKTTDR